MTAIDPIKYQEVVRSMEDFHARILTRQTAVCEVLGKYPDTEVIGLYSDSVRFEGDEFWAYGGHERHDYHIDIKWFTCSDEELEKMIIEEKERRAQEEQHKETKRIQEAEEKERKQYEMLKAKFEEG